MLFELIKITYFTAETDYLTIIYKQDTTSEMPIKSSHRQLWLRKRVTRAAATFTCKSRRCVSADTGIATTAQANWVNFYCWLLHIGDLDPSY